MRGRLENFKKIETQVEEQDNKVTEILILIRELYEMRLVERICRPCPYLHKEQTYSHFKHKFLSLHELMNQVQREYRQESGGTERGKSVGRTNVNNRVKYQREEMRRMENRYTEVKIPTCRSSLRVAFASTTALPRPSDSLLTSMPSILKNG